MCKKVLFLTSVVLIMALAGTNVVLGDSVLERSIVAGTDDAEEDLNPSKLGEVDMASTDLEFPYEDAGKVDPQLMALRFTDIAIPAGSSITAAWVRFDVDETRDGTLAANVLIEGELSLNPAGWPADTGPGSFGISSRPRTAAHAVWNVPNWTTTHERGPGQTTANIAAVIQEIVNQPGWTSGNALVLILRDDPANPSAGSRCAESFEGAAGNADQVPLLHIEFGAGPATIIVDPNGDIAAANELAKAGDTIQISAGTYFLASQIEIKDGVTYRGAGSGLTIIDGNNVTRAFAAWGDRFFNEDNGGANNSGPKNWILEGMTIRNCVADANDRFSYTSTAFALKTNFATLDTNASGGLDPAEADVQAGGIRLAGPDGTEGTADDDLHRFAHIDTDASGQISLAELDAQLLLREDEFGDESGDGGAITIANEATGTIQNCEFLNNHTPPEGDGDDGGAINITGLAVVTVNDCLFNGNYACSPNSTAIAGSDGDAGHIKVQGNSASALTPGTTLIANRCTFLNGNASDDAGAVQSSATGNVVRLDSCWFEGNTSWDNGNVCQFSSETQNEVTVTNCVFANNITKADNGPDRMIETNRNSKFINCTFVGNNQNDEDLIYNNSNAADTNGDGVDDETADTTQVVNCIFVNNIVGNGDDVLGCRNASFKIAATNCLFFGNKLQNAKAADNIQSPEGTETGSVNADPKLDAKHAPGAGSPAIDAGVNPATVGVTLTTDYNGNVRPQGAAYDIGAYEFVVAPPAN